MRKLSESIWSDIQDRSSGETVRKEDDINLLDRDGLYDYLIHHYKNTNSFDPIYNSDAFDTIKVPFLIQGGSDGVYLNFKENEVYIPYASPYKVKGLFSKLADEFSLKSDSNTRPTWYIISPKDGSEVTNTFFIYVIDFLIDNIPDSFEKGVKKIVNESIWSDIQDRSAGDTIRKEDEIVSNIKELKPVDMGCSVLWADRDIESDENVYFSFPDANKIIKNSGWRLPTFNEMIELNKNVIIYKNTLEEYIIHWYATHSDLTFEKCGYQYADDEDRVKEPDSYYAWTSDTAKSGSGAYRTIRIGKYISAVPMHYMNRCCVRLVKDK